MCRAIMGCTPSSNTWPRGEFACRARRATTYFVPRGRYRGATPRGSLRKRLRRSRARAAGDPAGSGAHPPSAHLDVRLRPHHDASMRTTLTLDPDVARMLANEAHRLRKPFKQVVNDALRRGLSPGSTGRVRRRYRVRPHTAMLRAGHDPGRLNALVDELEDQIRLRG